MLSFWGVSPHRLIATLVFCCALLLAACGPSATPTPTARPTEPPTEVEAVEVEETATEASAEADETEAADDESGDEATEAAEDGSDATEAADDEAGDAATEAAADEGDEAADATSEAGGSEASGDGISATVNVSTVRVRQEPSVAAAVVVEITRGTAVTALGQTPDAGYVQVRLEDGSEGWVAKQALAFEDPRVDLPVITP